MPPNLSVVLGQLGTSAEREVYLDAERRFGPFHSLVERSLAQRQAGLDAADAEPDEVRAWLSGLPVPPDTSVVVLWPSDKQGARMTFGSFVEHYDDLWYPAADDVLVYWENGDELGFVVLDHEEVFTAVPGGAAGIKPVPDEPTASGEPPSNHEQHEEPLEY
jgi:hypothetical protein